MLLVTHDHVLAERVADRVVGLGPAATEAMSDVTPVLEAAHV
jgi:ABC-type polar amino acid transport system ATPase subunit